MDPIMFGSIKKRDGLRHAGLEEAAPGVLVEAEYGEDLAEGKEYGGDSVGSWLVTRHIDPGLGAGRCPFFTNSTYLFLKHMS